MSIKLKKIVPAVVIVFVLYAILNSPQQSADIVHNAWGILLNGAERLFAFFNALLKR